MFLKTSWCCATSKTRDMTKTLNQLGKPTPNRLEGTRLKTKEISEYDVLTSGKKSEDTSFRPDKDARLLGFVARLVAKTSFAAALYLQVTG